MKPTLYLHIGHPKTGSSAFQVFLARVADPLKLQGIFYPALTSLLAASRGYVSSGNLPLGAHSENWLLAQVLPVIQLHQSSCKAFVFSNENLLHRMPEFFDALPAVLPYCHPHILLVVRNPLEQLSSVFQQLVKRHGYSASYEQFLAEHDYRCNALQKSARIVEQMDAVGVPYSLLNYSVLRMGIVSELARCLGVSSDLLVESEMYVSESAPVNRSLSAVELQLIILINAIYGQAAGRCLADALVNQLPEVQSVKLATDQLSHERVVAANQCALQILNARLPESSQLSFVEASSEPLLLHSGLSSAQLAVCQSALGSSRFESVASGLPSLNVLQSRVLELLSRAASMQSSLESPSAHPQSR